MLAIMGAPSNTQKEVKACDYWLTIWFNDTAGALLDREWYDFMHHEPHLGVL